MAAVGEHETVRLRRSVITLVRLEASHVDVGLEVLNGGGLRERYRCDTADFRLFVGALTLGCGRWRARGGW